MGRRDPWAAFHRDLAGVATFLSLACAVAPHVITIVPPAPGRIHEFENLLVLGWLLSLLALECEGRAQRRCQRRLVLVSPIERAGLILVLAGQSYQYGYAAGWNAAVP